MQIDFTTTAMVRPELLSQTYSSFAKHLSGIKLSDSRLFINVDPLPNGNPMEVISVAKRFFGEVQFHIATTPSHPAAVKWCWSQPDTEYIFNLQDDWVLTDGVSITNLVNELKTYSKRYFQIVLRAYKNQHNLSLAPSLITKLMYQSYAKKLETNIGPEVQMKKQRGITWLEGECPILPRAALIYPDHKVIRDIGRDWMKSSSFKHDSGFLEWERK